MPPTGSRVEPPEVVRLVSEDRRAPAARGPGAAVPAALFGAAALLGALAVVGKAAMREIPPPALALARAGGSAAILLLLARLAGPVAPPPGLWRRIAACGLLGVAMNQLLFLGGLSLTTATAASILVTSIPVFTALIAAVLGLERLSRRQRLGLATGLAGALLLVGASVAGLGGPGTSALGNAMVVANAFSFAAYLVASRPLAGRMPAMAMTGWIFAAGTVLILPFGAVPLLRLDWTGLSAAAVWGVIFVILSTVVAYVLVLWAVRFSGPTLTSLYVYLQPVVTAALGAALLGERLTVQDLVAAALIVAGVSLAISSRRLPGPSSLTTSR
jgi:drug/metabolite transporter (DMT)-like permease